MIRKNKSLLALSISILILIGCDMQSSKEGIKDVSGHYRLNLPCEDCKMNVHSILLNEDETFSYQIAHIGKDKIERHQGAWSIEGSNIQLNSGSLDEPIELSIENKMLRVLSPSNLLGKGKVDPLFAKSIFVESDENSAQFLNGTDIYAEGYKATWFIAIGINKFIQLKHPSSGEIIMLPYEKPKADYEEKTNEWRLNYKD